MAFPTDAFGTLRRLVPSPMPIAPWPAGRPLRTWQRPPPTPSSPIAPTASSRPPRRPPGKTTFGLHVAHRMLAEGRVRRVVVVAPTTHVCRQWAADAARYGIDLEPNRPNAAGAEPRDRRGVAVTYQTRRRRPGDAPAPLRQGADAADRRRAPPPRRARRVGPQSTRRRVRRRPLPPAALRHAVSHRRRPDPVGELRRRGRLVRRLRLRLHRRAARRRLPPGHVPSLRRRHGMDQRGPPAPRRLLGRAARRGVRAPAAHGARPGRRLDRRRPARCRRAAGRRARRWARGGRRPRGGDRQGARRAPRVPSGGGERRAARDRHLRRA